MTTLTAQLTKYLQLWPQWLVALIIHIVALQVGLAIGSTSPFLAKLTGGAEAIIITDNQASWVASLFSITRPIGAVIAAIVARRLGSKNAVLLGGIPHALGWSCLLMKDSVPWIYASRIMSGFGLGMYYSTFPLYICEISDPNIRGALISIVVQGLTIGMLLGNLLGSYLQIMTFGIVSLILTAIFFFSFLFVPDSPHYLIRSDRIDEADKSLQWFIGRKDVTNELMSLRIFMGSQARLTFKESFRQLATSTNRKIAMIVLCMYVFMQMSGLFTIVLYMEILLTSLKVDVIQPSYAVVAAGSAAVLSSLISIYTNDRFGRRIMLAISCIGVSINLFILGVNGLILRHGYTNLYLQWLSIIAMVMYRFFLHIGIIPISNCLMGELFPPQLREIGPCMANITSGVFGFITSKSYQPLLNATSEEFIFWFHSLFAFAMLIFVLTLIPETKGKTLQEIQMMMKSNRKIGEVIMDTKL